MQIDETFILQFVIFSLGETISHSQRDKNGDPSLKTAEAIVLKYDVTREGAWSLYRPIFWYLSDQKIITVDGSGWSLHSEYQNPSEDTLKQLAGDIVHRYKDTLEARLEKYRELIVLR